jgi:DNA-binding transcriptional ArsR family regulator
MDEQLEVFQALSDPTRLKIVSQIGVEERAVGEIVERMEIRQSGVSRHLRILQEAGIVQMRRDGQRRLYSLREEAFDRLGAWVSAYRRHWDARLDRLGTALEREPGSRTSSKESNR